MKKLLIFTLAFLVLLSSSGVMMNMHYCMGKFTGSSISLSYNSASNCTSCGMEKKANATKGCCHDSKTLLKNSTDQKLLNAEFRLTKSYPIVLFNNNNYQITAVDFLSTSSNDFIPSSPPSIQRLPIFIRNCSFLI
jgi:hypothetical protein